MTQDEIIEMARQAGYPLVEYEGKPYVPPMLAILLKTVTEAEREACAKIIDDSYETTTPGQGIPEDWLLTLSEAIRARGEA